jgi:sugar (pentulose or hexulose) kinase
LSPRPADDVVFFQGILEGIARVEADGYRLLSQLGAPLPSNIFSVGGGARNQAWSRIREEMLNIPVNNAVHDQAAYGAALLARNACLDASTSGTP